MSKPDKANLSAPEANQMSKHHQAVIDNESLLSNETKSKLNKHSPIRGKFLSPNLPLNSKGQIDFHIRFASQGIMAQVQSLVGQIIHNQDQYHQAEHAFLLNSPNNIIKQAILTGLQSIIHQDNINDVLSSSIAQKVDKLIQARIDAQFFHQNQLLASSIYHHKLTSLLANENNIMLHQVFGKQIRPVGYKELLSPKSEYILAHMKQYEKALKQSFLIKDINPKTGEAKK